MDEWGVVLVLITLFTFIVGVVAPLIKLNTSIVKLLDSVEMLNKLFDSLSADNSKSHKRIWDELDKHDSELNDHEKRIFHIERGEMK